MTALLTDLLNNTRHMIIDLTIIDSMFYSLVLVGRAATGWYQRRAVSVSATPTKLELEFAAASARAAR